MPPTSATSAPTTTAAADPWAVPSTITPAYLDRVLAELDHIDGEAFRDARAHNAITARFIQLEQAIRAGQFNLHFEETAISQEVAIRWVNIKADPGDRRITIKSILASPQPCVLAAVDIDFTARTVGRP